MADATVVDLITKLMEEELDKSTDREDRIKAVKRLPDVTAALGIEKTLEMLIPLLDRKITEDVDEDEMMLAVSGLLGKLVPAVGGAANAMVLFEPLLKLSKVEETLVRESATRSIIAVTDVIVHPTEAQAKMASDGLTSMYSDTECFFSKLSACAITPPVYRICRAAGSPEEKLKEMRSTFAEAVVDETPMIRRAAAAAIGELALAIADPALICSDVLPMLDKLYHEETEQDTVRVLAVKQVPLLIGPRLLTHPAAADASEPSAESIAIVEKCLGIIKAAAVDVSWRVRDATSKCFPEFATGLRELVNAAETADLAATYATLLTDKEMEVRLSAVKEIEKVARSCGAETFSECVLPVFDKVFEMGGDSDPSNKVKIALSMEMTKLFDVMKDAEVSVDPNETLLAMCFKLVDANEQVDSALLSVMESLKDIAPLVEKNPGNAEKLLGLLQKFVDPASQTVSPENWRLRRAVILAMAPVTKSLGVEKFEAELLQPYLNAFEDKISEVRSAATDAVVGVKEAFGVEFVMAKILGPLKASYVKHTYFLNRVVTIDAFKSVLGATVDAGIAGEVFAFLVKGIEDPVPNVRFTTVRALGEGAEYATDADVKTVIRPALDTAKNDSDADVAFFASEALKKLG